MIVEAALLLEDHYDAFCDKVWYIHTDQEIRIERLMSSRGYTREKAEKHQCTSGNGRIFPGTCGLYHTE